MQYCFRYQRASLVFSSFLVWGLMPPTLIIASAQTQKVFQTQWAAVYYQDPASLREMERRLSFSQVDNFYRSYFYTEDPVQAALAPRLAAKIDGLVAKVCLILGRRPSNTQRLCIFILKDGNQVKQRHLIFQPFKDAGSSWFGHGSLDAFYESRSHSIFLSLEDLHAGILAHELAHFVLCESSAVHPPAAEQENWARYVESSLD